MSGASQRANGRMGKRANGRATSPLLTFQFMDHSAKEKHMAMRKNEPKKGGSLLNWGFYGDMTLLKRYDFFEKILIVESISSLCAGCSTCAINVIHFISFCKGVVSSMICCVALEMQCR